MWTSSHTPLASQDLLSMSSVPSTYSALDIAGVLMFMQTAAAKGLVAGNLTLTRTDGTQACRKPDVVSMLLRGPNSPISH